MSLQREAAKRLPLLPNKTSDSPRSNAGREIPPPAQTGDLFWKCGVECFKPVYTRIDQQWQTSDPDKHARVLNEAKKILQEHRNLILHNVLPMFEVRKKTDNDGRAPSEADSHAADYFCRNVWVQMIDTLVASLPLFVPKDEREAVEATVRNIADMQCLRLERQLLNFAFRFRPVQTPQQVRKGK